MIPSSKILQIEATASDILRSIYPDPEKIVPPIPLNQILEKYGLALKVGDFKDKNIAGAFDKKKKEIYIASDDPVTRKAFTIAHELGHFILHDQMQREIFYRTQALKIAEETKEEEKEANWFAASLLMPDYLIKRYWQITREMPQLATIFGVSESAVYFRLKNLQLLD